MDRPNRPDINYLRQHNDFFGDITPMQPANLEKGQVIRFIYNGQERTVFVTHPKWEGKLHGLDLKLLPRRPFLTIVNAPTVWSEEKLYEMKINKPIIRKYQVFRTYDLRKITNLRTVSYNSILQPDEHDEQGIEEPEGLQNL